MIQYLFYFDKKKTFSAKCDSEEDSSKEVDKSSEKKAALEKNGWTMVEKEDLSKVKQTSFLLYSYSSQSLRGN